MGLLGHSTVRRPAGGLSLQVDGRSYGNAAAKFWMSLMDELQYGFCGADRLVLSAPSADPMGKPLLHPELTYLDAEFLAEDFDMARRMRETLAELEAMGPPASVHACVYCGHEALLEAALPEECLDAETFPCLVVWLLEWARVPLGRWNDPRVEGEVLGVNPTERCQYVLAFRVTHRKLSEGLFSREVTLVRPLAGWREAMAQGQVRPSGGVAGEGTAS